MARAHLIAIALLISLPLIMAALYATPAGRAWFSATVIPPPPPAEPVTVYLLQHGRHSSLVVPGEQGLARYAYGDWAYYALRQTDLTTGLAALFSPTPAAFGRRELPATERFDPAQLGVRVDVAHELRVEAAAAARLRQELDALFEAGEMRRHTPELDLELVTHPVPYTIAHNSNRVVGRWLEAVGCEVRGLAVLADWRIAEPGTQQ